MAWSPPASARGGLLAGTSTSSPSGGLGGARRSAARPPAVLLEDGPPAEYTKSSTSHVFPSAPSDVYARSRPTAASRPMTAGMWSLSSGFHHSSNTMYSGALATLRQAS
eukprot:scaffold58447_cov66-Phaeocystis_antarctica.AAC.2